MSKNLRYMLAAAIVYLAAFCFYSYPLILNWSSKIIGLDTAWADTPQILSNLFLFENGWKHGELWSTQQLFYPIGANLLMHGYTPGMGFLYLLSGLEPLEFLNYFTLFCFVLGGLGAFLLARKFNPHFFSALLVGFVYSFSSFHLAQWQDHYWYVINFTLPWYLVVFPSVFKFPPGKQFPRINSWYRLLICFFIGVVSASLDYYTTFFLLYLSAFYVLWKWLGPLIRWQSLNWKKLLLIFMALFACSLLIDELRKAGFDDHHGLYWSGDLAGLVIPQNSLIYNGLIGNQSHWGWLQPGPEEKNLFLGLGLIIALIWAFVHHYKMQKNSRLNHLLLALLLLFALCFPVLKLAGFPILKLPTAFLHYIPFVNNVRVPTRWGIVLFLFIPLYVVSVQWQKNPSVKYTNWSAVLLLITALEFWPNPYRFFPENDYTHIANQIKSEPGEVLLTLPFGIRDGYKMLGEQDNLQLYLQTHHHKKLIGGYLSRVPKSVFDFYEGDDLCADLFASMETHETIKPKGNYADFFHRFHPDLLLVREDYLTHPAFELFKMAAALNKVELIPISNGLWRLIYH